MLRKTKIELQHREGKRMKSWRCDFLSTLCANVLCCLLYPHNPQGGDKSGTKEHSNNDGYITDIQFVRCKIPISVYIDLKTFRCPKCSFNVASFYTIEVNAYVYVKHVCTVLNHGSYGQKYNMYQAGQISL